MCLENICKESGKNRERQHYWFHGNIINGSSFEMKLVYMEHIRKTVAGLFDD